MTDSVRLDKWLWAARFYKTRSIARQAIDGGKVYYQGSRVKPGRSVAVGANIVLRQGYDDRTIIVKDISDKRQSAPLAQLLYEETQESVTKREEAMLNRKISSLSLPHDSNRPDKKQRRDLKKFKDNNEGS